MCSPLRVGIYLLFTTRTQDGCFLYLASVRGKGCARPHHQGEMGKSFEDELCVNLNINQMCISSSLAILIYFYRTNIRKWQKDLSESIL